MAYFIGTSIGAWLAYSTFNVIIGWLVITAGYVALAFYAVVLWGVKRFGQA